MNITCPECGFSRSVPDDRIPATSSKATCPKCRAKFVFRPQHARRQSGQFSEPRGQTGGMGGMLRERAEPARSAEHDRPRRSRAVPTGRDDVEFYSETLPAPEKAAQLRPEQAAPAPEPVERELEQPVETTDAQANFAEAFPHSEPVQPAARRPVSPDEADELWGGPPERPAAPPARKVFPWNSRPSKLPEAPEPLAPAGQTATQPTVAATAFKPTAGERVARENEGSPASAPSTSPSTSGAASGSASGSAWTALDGWGSAAQDPDAENDQDFDDEDVHGVKSQPCPWEDERLDVFTALVSTVRSALLAPAQFFGSIRLGGGLVKPMLFVLVVAELAAVADFALELAGVSTWAIMRGRSAPMLGGSSAAWLLLAYPLFMCLGIVALTAYRRACLGLTGAFANLGATTLGVTPMEAVFRTMAYASSAALIWVAPLIGPPLAIFWFALISIVGLKHALKASLAQVALACLIPDFLLGLVVTWLAVSSGLAP